MLENSAEWPESQPSRLLAIASAVAQVERTHSVDDPIASAVINSLRFELEAAHEMIFHLQQELRKAGGDSDD